MPPPARPRLPLTALWALMMLGVSTALILIEAPRFAVWPLDSYYYLSKAENLMRTGALATPWAGLDSKFFPGYSVILGPLSLLSRNGSWIAAMLAALWVSALLIVKIGETLLRSHAAAWAAAALWATHPVMLKWATVPMSEVTAITFALGAVLCALRGIRRPRALWALLAGIFSGMAISTRAEMAALAMPLGLLWISRRRVSRPRWIAWGALGLVAGSAPLILWGLQLWQAGRNLHYLGEAASHPIDPQAWRHIHTAVYQVGFLGPVPSGVMAIDAWLLAVSCLTVAALVLAFGGVLGAWAFGAALIFVAYLGAHSLWHYHYERFLVPLLPVAALLLAGAGAWWVEHGTRWRSLRARVACACLVITTLCWLFYGRVLIRDHRYWLSQGFPSSVAGTAAFVESQTPRGSLVFTDLGPTLAYHLDRSTVFTEAIPDFYPAAFEPEHTLDQIAARRPSAIVTRRSASEWFTAALVPPAARQAFRTVSLQPQGAVLLIDHSRLRTDLESSDPAP